MLLDKLDGKEWFFIEVFCFGDMFVFFGKGSEW